MVKEKKGRGTMDNITKRIQKNEKRLKPCPYCGGKATVEYRAHTWIIECGMHSAMDESLKKAVKKWNKV